MSSQLGKILRRVVTFERRGLATLSGSSFASKETWAQLKRKKWATDHALENFDEYYGPLFGARWPSIRLALLCQRKYCAVVNNYSDVDQATEFLESSGAFNIRSVLNVETVPETNSANRCVSNSRMSQLDVEQSVFEEELPTSTSSATVDLDEDDRLRFKASDRRSSSGRRGGAGLFNEFVPATKLSGLDEYVTEADYASTYRPLEQVHFESVVDEPSALPAHWKIYSYERGDLRRFRPPRRSSLNVFDYYLMDAASLLPVYALNVRDGDRILDLCSAPGGKALAMLQTLESVNLVCNDASASRTNRLRTVIDSYVPADEDVYNRVAFTTYDGADYEKQPNQFNKILVDVPCTTDRHAANKNDNNVFHPIRMKERIRLPEMQIKLLSAALKAVKVGGTVVYSTCALSPVQNDGVVHMALRNLWETTSSKFVIHDLSAPFRQFSGLFRFHLDPTPRYGQLVLPFLPLNYGPTYVCKLSKLAECGSSSAS